MIYIFPSNYKVPSIFNYLNNENTVYYDNEHKLYSILKNIDILFLTEHYSLDYFKLKDYNKKKKLEHISIYFIAHGVTGFYYMNEDTLTLTKKKTSPLTPWGNYILNNKNVFFITCCNFIQNHLLESTNYQKKNQIIKTNHIPQFSYNSILYNNVTSKADLDYLHKSVVIFPVFHREDSTEIMDIIVKNLIDVVKNVIIKIKPKVNYDLSTAQGQNMLKWQKDLKKTLTKHKGINITFTSNTNNGQYFHCDKVITINGGTSFFEALTHNNKTFNIQFNNTWEYQKIPGSYKKLLICNNINEFITKLYLIKDKNYFDNDYEKEKEKLFAMQLGSTIKKENTNDWNNMVNNIIMRKHEEEFEMKWNNHTF
jgi:hypothetical protein